MLEIKKYPDPILRKKSKEVKEITPEIKQLAQDLIETMLKSEPEGIGLAAPQVGVSKRVIAVATESGPAVLVNPRIVKKSREKEVMEEGCLSLPKVWLDIKRPKEVEVEAIDINGKKLQIRAEGVFAKILQHEIDHLDGILIINRVNPWQKLKRTLKRSQKKGKNG